MVEGSDWETGDGQHWVADLSTALVDYCLFVLQEGVFTP